MREADALIATFSGMPLFGEFDAMLAASASRLVVPGSRTLRVNTP